MPPKENCDKKKENSNKVSFIEDEDVTVNKPATGAAIVNNPNVIPPEDCQLLRDEFRLEIGKRLKRGRFGVVYDGEFLDNFTLDKFRKWKTMHFLYVKKADLQLMKAGQKFAIKYCDIENRKAYNVVDIEERIKKEINFIKRIEMESCASIVNTFFVFALTPIRYYIVMELADNNLQCVISDLNKANRLLEPSTVIEMYASLVRTIRSLHKQKLTYGMLRTSNVLAFYPKAPTSAAEIATNTAPKSGSSAGSAAIANAPKSGSSAGSATGANAPKSGSTAVENSTKSASSAGGGGGGSTAIANTTKSGSSIGSATTKSETPTPPLAVTKSGATPTPVTGAATGVCGGPGTVTKTGDAALTKLPPTSPSPSVISGGSLRNSENFTLKIADFVNSVDGKSPDSFATIDEAVEQDLDDLFYIHYEIFALARFDFAKYQAFKESLKIMTEINAHQDSVETMNKVLELINKLKRELPGDKLGEKPSNAS